MPGRLCVSACVGGGEPIGASASGRGPDSAWRNRAPGPHRNTARQAMDGLWTEACGQRKQSNDPGNNQHNPQYANYWAPLTRKRHIPPHSAQPQHTNHWAPRTRKRHQQEHWPQRPTERSAPTQHAEGRTGDRPTTRRNVTQGGGRGGVWVWVFCRWAPHPPPHPRGGSRHWPRYTNAPISHTHLHRLQ